MFAMAGTDVTNPSPQDTVFAELIHGAAKVCRNNTDLGHGLLDAI